LIRVLTNHRGTENAEKKEKKRGVEFLVLIEIAGRFSVQFVGSYLG
jgi:hypothetical protein